MASPCNKCSTGPGYSSPQEAFEKGPREKILFVCCPNVSVPQKPDMIAAVDVDPESKTYCQVVSQVILPNIGDEVHHTGWNACSSCYNDVGKRRQYLVVPCLASGRIYFVNTSDPKNLTLHKTIEGSELEKNGVSWPHTAHCLADGNIMVSTMGNAAGENQGNFLLIDGNEFKISGKWPANGEITKFGYDFWYQPRRNVMISTEWGNPNKIRNGFNLKDLLEGQYGNSVHIWDWNKRTLKQTINLDGPTGLMPLEVRFLHDPTKDHAFVGSALGSAIYHLYRDKEDGEFKHRLAATIEPKKVESWDVPTGEIPGLCTDVVLSMDDRFLYVSQWLHGDIRQYDISNPFDVRLSQPKPLILPNGKKMEGGPQMLQLSLDGKRLYVTGSLYSVWDKQFYLNMTRNCSVMLQLDVDTQNGGLTLNKDFLVDFSSLPNGPYLCHEMRYPGGDCTSDIWA
ncbi:56kDa selenium binding protein (SBP56) domain-containing protein [Ditylenchus destructor]|uniref:Methanethiol oxidase n=1 Tax=Ditylenchus destructor TaxID=166010 RepID=A0AAD4R4W7_9BILA|nr:56kDa selenium binding protein (SBP56) domain-containing protein [Ditylenchus destructor]